MGLENLSLAVSFHAEVFKNNPAAAGAFITASVEEIAALQSHMPDIISLGRFFDAAAGGTGVKYNAVRDSAIGLGERLSQTNQALKHLGRTNEILPVLTPRRRPVEPHCEIRDAHAVFMTQAARMERYTLKEEQSARGLLYAFAGVAVKPGPQEELRYYLSSLPDVTEGHRADLQRLDKTLGAFRFGHPKI